MENLVLAKLKKDARAPITGEMLNVLDSGLDHNDLKDTSVFATACCAFWGQLRIGKILSKIEGSFKQGCIPMASDLRLPTML
jgi:hypothetical protein